MQSKDMVSRFHEPEARDVVSPVTRLLCVRFPPLIGIHLSRPPDSDWVATLESSLVHFPPSTQAH